MDIDSLHKYFFIVFMFILAIVYLPPLFQHYTQPKECTIMKGQCKNNQYCGINGKCVEGKEGDSCFLGLAQCQRPFNCMPDFKCHRF
jgi:hypothetical protein